MDSTSLYYAQKVVETLTALKEQFPGHDFSYVNDREFEFYVRGGKEALQCVLRDSGPGLASKEKTRWSVSCGHLDIRAYAHDAPTAMYRFGVKLADKAKAYWEAAETMTAYVATEEPPPPPKPKPRERDTYCRQKIGCTCDACMGIIPGLG